MLGTILDLTVEDKNDAVQAIEEIIPSLNKGEVSQYEMAVKKFKSSVIFTDGILMRCAENALRYKAKKADCKFSKLADNIQRQRETFQFNQMKRMII